jgi:hypothetical protein
MSIAAFAEALSAQDRPITMAKIGPLALGAIRADLAATSVDVTACLDQGPRPDGYLGRLFGVECWAQDAEGIRMYADIAISKNIPDAATISSFAED